MELELNGGQSLRVHEKKCWEFLRLLWIRFIRTGLGEFEFDILLLPTMIDRFALFWLFLGVFYRYLQLIGIELYI